MSSMPRHEVIHATGLGILSPMWKRILFQFAKKNITSSSKQILHQSKLLLQRLKLQWYTFTKIIPHLKNGMYQLDKRVTGFFRLH